MKQKRYLLLFLLSIPLCVKSMETKQADTAATPEAKTDCDWPPTPTQFCNGVRNEAARTLAAELLSDSLPDCGCIEGYGISKKELSQIVVRGVVPVLHAMAEKNITVKSGGLHLAKVILAEKGLAYFHQYVVNPVSKRLQPVLEYVPDCVKNSHTLHVVGSMAERAAVMHVLDRGQARFIGEDTLLGYVKPECSHPYAGPQRLGYNEDTGEPVVLLHSGEEYVTPTGHRGIQRDILSSGSQLNQVIEGSIDPLSSGSVDSNAVD